MPQREPMTAEERERIFHVLLGLADAIATDAEQVMNLAERLRRQGASNEKIAGDVRAASASLHETATMLGVASAAISDMVFPPVPHEHKPD